MKRAKQQAQTGWQDLCASTIVSPCRSVECAAWTSTRYTVGMGRTKKWVRTAPHPRPIETHRRTKRETRNLNKWNIFTYHHRFPPSRAEAEGTASYNSPDARYVARCR